VTRNLALGAGEVAHTACARVLVRGGTDEKTGEALSAAAVSERVSWCAALVRGMAAHLVTTHWQTGDMQVLSSGKDEMGRPLPTQAWMALRRLGWSPDRPDGVTVNDRIVRMAQEQAGRVLRSACWRDALVRAVTATWPTDPGRRTPEEWDAVRAAAPGREHLPCAVIRARTQQVARFAAADGRLPIGVTDLEPPPRVPWTLILSSCDRQQATLERHDTDSRRVLLRLQLPVRPDPHSYRDWTWIAIPLALPPTVPAGASLHLPTLRVTEGRARADIAFTHPAPGARRDGHTVALGIDWGLNTLLSAGAVRLFPDGSITSLGSGAQYRANGVLARAQRLRRHGEQLQAKLVRYGHLIAGREDHPLAANAAAIRDEAGHVAARRSRLNGALAWSAARWAADQAIAAGATVIYLEDLRSLEARGMSRAMNTRLSQTVRGQVTERLRHITAEHGIAVVTVPPRGTSRCCPHCLAPLTHCKAPSQPTVPGWKWAMCPACGWQGDRDTGAWQRVASRGLTHQAKTTTNPGSTVTVIRAIDDDLEARAVVIPYASGRDRSKTGPTARRSTPRPAPRRRAAPSPPRPAGRGGQRPEGHATTARLTLPRAASRDQGATTTSLIPVRRPHRARGAALGAGFHLHAHATPSREADLSPVPHPQDN
jgi:IS605 OrfB family transposase